MLELLTLGIGAFLLTAILGKLVLPKLIKLKIGQSIREEGPESHLKKTGTPTMGGIMFLLSAALMAVVLALLGKLTLDAIMILLALYAFGLVGFLDDYIKIVKKRNLGLTAKQKLVLQFIFSIALAIYVYLTKGSQILIPFTKGYQMDLGILFIPFMFFVIVGTVNAVNLTDGLDGLSSGVTLIVMVFFAVLAYTANRLDLGYIAVILAGGCGGFLVYNRYPAKVFMGDTGSLALGGAVAMMASIYQLELLILLAGSFYFIEILSVIIQVTSFKTRGKRVFKMAPIHHHFELCGWSETKIVWISRIYTALVCLISYLSVQNIFI